LIFEAFKKIIHLVTPSLLQVERSREKEEDRQLSVKVSVMQPILRFLQLLCENHNKQLQNLLRWAFSNQNQSFWIRDPNGFVLISAVRSGFHVTKNQL
jgi:hypothetical protein